MSLLRSYSRLRRWLSAGQKRGAARLRPPQVEQLETREAPAVFQVSDVSGLIAAINISNGNAEADTIDLAPGTYTFGVAENFWYGPNALPAISGGTANPLIINGNGATLLRDGAAPPMRFFYVSGGFSGLAAGSLTLNNLELQGGLAQGGNGGDGDFGGGGGLGAGGAIYNQGTLTLNGVLLTGNTAQGGTGGNDIGAVGHGGGGGMGGNGGRGGGLSGGGGGGMQFDGLGGAAPGGNDGGGFTPPGFPATNRGGRGGTGSGLGGVPGGIGGAGASGSGSGGGGGGFGFGVVGDALGQNGGGFGGNGGDLTAPALNDGGDGAGSSAAGSPGGGGAFGGGGGGSASAGGSIGGGGGGIGGGGGGAELSGNGGGGGFGGGGGGGSGNGMGGFGGGGGASLAVSTSRFGGGTGGSGNGASGGGGGAGSGGAIFNHFGTLTINNSTLTANTAAGGTGGAGAGVGAGGTGAAGLGGALFNLNGTVIVVNSTFSGNAVATGANGTNGIGGPSIGSDGADIYNLAFGNNFNAPTAVSATATMTNSILANGTGGSDLAAFKIDGAAINTSTVNISANNLVMARAFAGGATITGTPVSTANPNLGVLQNNGGPTRTLALLAGSPAIDTGDNAGAPATDQRGFNRPVFGGISLTVDLGAYEFQASPTATTTLLVSSLNPSNLGQEVTFTATVAGNFPGSNTPVGTVTFTIDGLAGVPIALVNGVATFSTSTLSAGSHTVVAAYSGGTLGDITFSASTSAKLTQVVNGGATVGGLIATGTDLYGAPEVKVFDATGALKFDFLAYDAAFLGGVRVAVGDVNGDGTPDIITVPGVGGGPLVMVFSGKDLTLILSFNAYDPGLTTGLYVAAGDVNHDGFADIITAPDQGGGPLVNVFDGKTGAKRLSFNAYDPAFFGGVRVAAGDTNGDGFAEIITGPGYGGGPLVRIFDGRTGAGLLTYNAYAASFVGGIFVGAGDVDGDGKADVLTTPGVGGGPLVNVFSGPTGGLIRSFNAYPPVATPLPIFGSDGVWQSGLHVAALDVNGDGKADIITGVGPSQRPEVKVFDAVSLAVLDDFFAYDPAYLGGVFVGAGR